MSTTMATRLLEDCTRMGLSVTMQGGRLLVDAPQGTAADALITQLATHKPAIVAALTHSHNSHNSQNRPAAPFSGDPRPDLESDSRFWHYLLRHAQLEDEDDPRGAFGALHGVRCCGARLEWQANGSLRIVADAEYLGSFEDNRETWLMPHRAQIAAWLRVIAEGEREYQERSRQREAGRVA